MPTRSERATWGESRAPPNLRAMWSRGSPMPEHGIAGGSAMRPVISIQRIVKSYASGVQALKPITLEINKGEIFALLGPNGAGKTTLINIICGIVTASGGTVTADGHDIVRGYRAARAIIGLVPQELSTDAFETVWATVAFSRGLFGRAPNPPFIERLQRS